MKKNVSSDDIIHAMNKFVGYEIKFNTRKREHCLPKQIIQYLINKVVGINPNQIGFNFNCQRATIMHSIGVVEDLLTHKDFQIKYRSLFEQFGIEIVDYGFNIKN